MTVFFLPDGASQPNSQHRGARFARLLRQLVRRPLVVIGLLIVGVILLAALLAPLIAPYDPYQVRMDNVLKAPSSLHMFGTDELGRDVLSRVLYGARISVLEGLFAVFIAVVLGVPLGMAAGYAGGFVENAIMRIVDVMLAFPGVLLAVVIVAILGPSLVNAMVAVGLYTMPIFARLARGATLSVRAEPYIESCRAVGMSSFRIVVKHVLPNIAGTLWVMATLHVGLAILSASSLSFLGLGAQAPSPEWGAMLSNGRSYMLIAPHVVVFPGVAILLFVLGINLVYDGLRTILDPKSQER